MQNESTNLERILALARYINDLLSRYIAVNDNIFKSPLRKIIPIPGIFQKIDNSANYHLLLNIEVEMVKNIDDLNELVNIYNIDTDEYKFLSTLLSYSSSLLNAITSLKIISEKMNDKIDGNQKYAYTTYDKDVKEYDNYVSQYLSYGGDVNFYHKKLVMKRYA